MSTKEVIPKFRQTPPSLGQLTLPLAFALFQTHIIFHQFIGLDVHYC